ncbi:MULTISPECIES: hypothetical protein [Halomicrobium]|uniref:DUF2975 domain-containing protein n=2 Tax=Halomicrobium mukohataei TaxID=57705 RepID=C7NYV1_HALMD|nr:MULTISPECIES: hypothetical protein [Halomicrobium]ACV48640.1 hypothetical protein Hmuk_2532 [Halomicrobium mukohataei DSM 12286]QCD67039.1 hypothetical protein E5139_15805 [Halomicrobium mukohataei]QFR21849.1 hypothetical protein GBQ70_15825 [Halomicrobium sp. ZPS1]
MSPSARSVARTVAALFSSVVLLAPLTFALLVGGAVTVLDLLGLTVPEPLALVGPFVAGAVALWLAVESALVQLHGVGVLDRGGPIQRRLRYLAIGVTVVASVVAIGRFLAMTVPWAIETGSTSVLVLAGALALAVVGTLYRTITAARTGYERVGRAQADEPRR